MTTEPYPCPKCGAYQLVYDGMLVWHSDERRPPRKMARKRGKPPPALDRKQSPVSLRLRSDYTWHSLYHCANCRAEFSHNRGQSTIHLYEEGVSGKYVYDKAAQSWHFESFAQFLQALEKLRASRGHEPQARPGIGATRKRGLWSRKSFRHARDLGRKLELVFFVVVVSGLTALSSVLLNHDGYQRGAMLGVSIGLLQAILNGPRPKSKRENPSAGAILGGFVALLTIQVASATAAAIGALRGRWKRHVLVEMADSAKGIWYEGGVFVALPGLVIGAITGIILALMGAGGM